MKNVLIPTDFSEHGKLAENVGISIAAKAKAIVEFIHIMDVPIKWTNPNSATAVAQPEEIKISVGRARDYLNGLIKRATDIGLTAQQHLSYNGNITELYEHIKDHKPDLVVIGSHGKNGWKESFLGSNAQKIIRNSISPVLILRSPLETMSFKKIVFASTFKENVQEAFEKVRKFALTFQSEIELLYINLPYNFEETHRSQSRMNEFVALYPGLNFKTHIYNAFDEESGILKYAKENQVDLIAVVTHGKSSFAQMLSPSICESLACNSEIPVLSVHI